jgi:hypothetical protein
MRQGGIACLIGQSTGYMFGTFGQEIRNKAVEISPVSLSALTCVIDGSAAVGQRRAIYPPHSFVQTAMASYFACVLIKIDKTIAKSLTSCS